MSQIDRYLGRTLISGTFTVLVALMSLHYIFGLVEQTRSVGKGDYQLIDAAFFMAMDLPQAMVEMFPVAMLLGALLSIGNLATQSEITVMRAIGMSASRIIWGVVKTGIVLALVTFGVSETVAPHFKNKAETMRAEKMSGGQMTKSKQSLWARDGNHIIYIRRVVSASYLEDLVIFDIAASQTQINQIIEAKSAHYQNDSWLLKDLTTTRFGEQDVVHTAAETMIWPSLLSASQLNILTIEPDELDLKELTDYRNYLKNSGIDSAKQDLVFWNKVLQPAAAITMLLLSLGFIFGPLRSGNFGLRLVVGVMAGFLFYLTNKMFGPVTLVYQVPPLVGASAPIVITLCITAWLYKHAD